VPNAIFSQLKSLATRLPNLGKRFGRSAESSIGLDIGSFSVKAVFLVPSASGPRIQRSVVELFGAAADLKKKAGTIRSAMDSLGAGRDVSIVAGVGGMGTVVRSVLLPEMSGQELNAALSFEAEKYIPFKLDETFFDSSVLGKRAGGRMEVLLAAARKELVNAHVEILSLADIQPSVLDLEALALANAWEAPAVDGQGQGESKVACLLHVGARGTILDFFQGKQFQFTREIPIGGDAFTQAIAQALQLNPVEAEKLKCQPAEKESQVRAVLEPSWEEWLVQCRVSFDFFENQFGHKVERLALSGGSADLIGFREKVLQSTGLPVDIFNVVAAFPSDSSSPATGSALSVAMGLALRGGAAG